MLAIKTLLVAFKPYYVFVMIQLSKPKTRMSLFFHSTTPSSPYSVIRRFDTRETSDVNGVLRLPYSYFSCGRVLSLFNNNHKILNKNFYWGLVHVKLLRSFFIMHYQKTNSSLSSHSPSGPFSRCKQAIFASLRVSSGVMPTL